MADKRDQWANSFSAEPQSGWLTGFLADEGKGGRRMMWRLGSWGVAAVGAVTVAILATQSQVQWRRDQFAASDALARQSEQIQHLTKEAQAENRRLVQAIETLNSDRDRLYTRVTSVEKNLESVTGSILVKQSLPVSAPREPAPRIAAPTTLPSVSADVATSASPDLPTIPSRPADTQLAADQPPRSGNEPVAEQASSPDPAPVETTSEVTAATAAVEPPAARTQEPSQPLRVAVIDSAPAEVATPVARTEFGVDLGGANSVDGLRAIWRAMAKSPAMIGLRPVIAVKERSGGLGMQLRLIAGPLTDAAAAARICATLSENKRACETTVFDGQRLALKSEATTSPAEHPAAIPKPRPAQPRRAAPKQPPPASAPPPVEQRSEQPQPPRPVEEAQAQAPKPTPTLRSWLGFASE